jgi:hypothetical protein
MKPGLYRENWDELDRYICALALVYTYTLFTCPTVYAPVVVGPYALPYT